MDPVCQSMAPFTRYLSNVSNNAMSGIYVVISIKVHHRCNNCNSVSSELNIFLIFILRVQDVYLHLPGMWRLMSDYSNLVLDM